MLLRLKSATPSQRRDLGAGSGRNQFTLFALNSVYQAEEARVRLRGSAAAATEHKNGPHLCEMFTKKRGVVGVGDAVTAPRGRQRTILKGAEGKFKLGVSRSVFL